MDHNSRVANVCGQVKVFGWFSYQGAGDMAVIDGLGEAGVKNYLTESFFPQIEEMFPQDKVFIFKTQRSDNFANALYEEIRKKSSFEVLLWPPRHEDFDPMSRVWSRLANNIDCRRFFRDGPPKNALDLENDLLDTWDNIFNGRNNFLRKFVDEFPSQMEKVVDMRGAKIHSA